jgi:hypothetical protein
MGAHADAMTLAPKAAESDACHSCESDETKPLAPTHTGQDDPCGCDHEEAAPPDLMVVAKPDHTSVFSLALLNQPVVGVEYISSEAAVSRVSKSWVPPPGPPLCVLLGRFLV